MLAILSPAKKLDMEPNPAISDYSHADFSKERAALLAVLKQCKAADLKRLMGISDKLADLNLERFAAFQARETEANAKQAALTFSGDTYVGLDARSLTPDDLQWAQDHLRILSGLYGLLRPLDLIQPYRLEMGTKLATSHGEDLYDFWGDRLAKALAKAVAGHRCPIIVNLASAEYAKAVLKPALKSRVIDCQFKEEKDGQSRVIGLFAKRARGMMARHIIRNRIETEDGLQAFTGGGYRFCPNLSNAETYVFTRPQPPKAGKQGKA